MLIRTVLAVALSLALSGSAFADAAADALRARLRTLSDAGDYQAVLVRTEAELMRDDGSVVALEYRGYAHHRMGEHAKASVAYTRLVSVAPEHAWGHAQLGTVYAHLGRFDEAVRALERSVALDPAQTSAWKSLELAHRSRSDYDAAVDVTLRALGEGIDPAWCYRETGYLEYARGNLGRARSAFRRAGQAGASPGDVEHGLDLVDLALAAAGGKTPEVGVAWNFEVSGLRVESGLGAALPDDMRELIARSVAHVESYVAEIPRDQVTIRLTRTFEEHEATRRLKFPKGTVGRAFTERIYSGFSRGRRKARKPSGVVIHAAWPSPTLRRSLSHELVHAATHGIGGTSPAWFDEGLATYLEFDLEGRAPSPREGREDLIETMRNAERLGGFHDEQILLSGSDLQFAGPRSRLAYAQSWCFVHYLLNGRRGLSGRAARVKFLSVLDPDAASRRGPGRASPQAHLAEVYGTTVELLIRGWRAHRDKLLAR